MGYRLLADAAMLLHFGFLCYVALGGFLVWRWPRAFWPHLAVCAYALGIIDFEWQCPLTGIEHWARERAGLEGLPAEGFIDHYLTGVVYPERYLAEVQFAVGVVVALSWLVALYLLLRWRRAAGERAGQAGSR
ncbi:DUF2784 domain-containing protein [Streptomonospora salina]|uniref:DUF2784 domain-containing protein n=1 Tax=Streptomonospora salina TaxID=104205 RepID=A0A841DYY7_9ACTN|nr:DUF2784 domain-containing protein [Streptomonospora salina]MBB5996687.1 hypothetical protein [Streptomonospora salina]